MPFSLTPDRMFDCYAQITPTFLRQQGITLLLSDLDFTLAAKKTRRAAAQNLRQKGLAAGEIQQALDAVYTPDVSGEDPELKAAAALVEGHYRKKLEAGRRDLVIAALQRRGFSYSVIKSVSAERVSPR